uniref:Uncharacterized protein n=1 Tax=Lepeophtheirus salmonis TaxID=72036 RepID=A0A0K2UAC0_LEPSM
MITRRLCGRREARSYWGRKIYIYIM